MRRHPPILSSLGRGRWRMSQNSEEDYVTLSPVPAHSEDSRRTPAVASRRTANISRTSRSSSRNQSSEGATLTSLRTSSQASRQIIRRPQRPENSRRAMSPGQVTRSPSRGSSSGSRTSISTSNRSSSRGSRRRSPRIRSRRPRTRESRNGNGVDDSNSMTSNLNNSEVTVLGSQQDVDRSARSSRRRSRSKSHVSFALSGPGLTKSNVLLVMEAEKCLQRVFCNLNWNELLVARQVCKKWLEVISSDQKLKESSAVIAIRKDFEALPVFNDSSIIWTQFRFYSPAIIDLAQTIQKDFWMKHGTSITFLELRSPSLTLSGLVEVLSRCPNLVHLLIIWTPEMYSFNPELIKKYYGISIRNGALGKIISLTIEKSSYLTDNALLSLLRWCGSSLHSLTLTCSSDDIDESLSRLKPRWTIDPIEAFVNRFSYARNLKFLDFTGSNLNSTDLVRLGDMEKFINLTGIRLSRCKLTDESTLQFLIKKGTKLEELYLDYTPVTDQIFDFRKNKDLNLRKLRVLDISGTQNFKSPHFLPDLAALEDFRCGDTGWLNYSMLPKPIEEHGLTKALTKVNFSRAEKCVPKGNDEISRSAWFLHFSTILRKLTELNLNYWTTFGTDENFKIICVNIPHLRKLRIRSWNITDEGITGFSYGELTDLEDSDQDSWANAPTRWQKQSLARLKHLHLIDLGGCLKLTDLAIKFGILCLSNLRTLGLDGSQVTDAGIHVLIAKCKTLDKLCLLGCDQITPKTKRINRLDGRSLEFGPIRLN